MYLTIPPVAGLADGSVGEGAVEAISLGVAIFQTGLPLVTGGDFSSQSSTVSYIHERTPASQQFRECNVEFSLKSKCDTNPVRHWVFGEETFWFRLSFEYNGNDVRHARVRALTDRSSAMVRSKFSINFEGREHSSRNDPVAEVVFLVSGRWDPVGRGDVSFEGRLYVKADGSVRLSRIQSERDWVYVGQPPRSHHPGKTTGVGRGRGDHQTELADLRSWPSQASRMVGCCGDGNRSSEDRIARRDRLSLLSR